MNQQIKYCLYFNISPVYEQVKLILVVSHVLTCKQTRCQHVVNFTKFLCPLNGIRHLAQRICLSKIRSLELSCSAVEEFKLCVEAHWHASMFESQ